MTLAETGTMEIDAKIQYLHMLVRGKALRQFALLSADVVNTETLNVDYYIKCLALYFPCEFGFKKKRNASCNEKPRSLKLRLLRGTFD